MKNCKSKYLCYFGAFLKLASSGLSVFRNIVIYFPRSLTTFKQNCIFKTFVFKSWKYDFFQRDKDGNGNSFINNQYVYKELQRRSEYRITLDNVLFFLNLSSLSSSRILNVCSLSNLI